MILRVLFPLLTIFLLAGCDTNSSLPLDIVDTHLPTDRTIEETGRPSLCTVCNCTDRYVNCSNRALENHFNNSQWSDIKAAKEISFEGNLLVHVTPFPKIIVERLILRKNRIAVIDYSAFKELVNLTELDLSYNQLTSQRLQPHVFEGKFSPEAYEPLSNLKTLNLAGNSLHWLHQSLFEHLASLKVLNLSENPFIMFDYRTSIAISSLSYLEELDISYCSLKELPKIQFHTAKYLKKLNLAGNSLVYVPTSLEGAEALECLRLDDNPIKVIDHTNAFPNLTNLREVSLCYMQNLTAIENGGLSKLVNLENLYVQNCPKLQQIDDYALGYQNLEGGATWPPLKKLIISDNALRYLPAMLVGRWDKLEELDLMNNEWSCDCNNQFLVGILLPQYGKRLMGDEVGQLTCSAPPEHEGRNLTSLTNWHLRCLDLYNARPERDAAILVGMMIGLLIAIPVAMAFFVLWRRGFFFCGSQSPASFSRAFYKRASNDDDI
ncbi:PREDICTED: leucine-rich repeat neuronal protein 2-like [Dinoponera quadriceps]|uniref:Leucine-rich repeat neuronal protein 2-like n=1 Tax=Dinoponera quadriceps TaxID=609295 RepID=A0A6P3YDY6_DINQU|nr:PREDICTED: leucine-rich repeat neuronal protein 2-like [Dinoponera quadriceps]